jgi:hypothetical protein
MAQITTSAQIGRPHNLQGSGEHHMRRLCFDTESDAYNTRIGVLDVGTSQKQMAERHRRCPITFHCAILYDEHENQFQEFTSADLPALVAKLATADVLISQNGKRWDIPVLEQVCGANTITPLWSIEHKDLMELTNWQALDCLARQYIPDQLPGMQLAYDERVAEAGRQFPGFPWGSTENFRPPSYLIACKLAKARFVSGGVNPRKNGGGVWGQKRRGSDWPLSA